MEVLLHSQVVIADCSIAHCIHVKGVCEAIVVEVVTGSGYQSRYLVNVV